jgi:EAL domain-containing protein (putative c-di-GMP-specific phosphodiesterase class I)
MPEIILARVNRMVQFFEDKQVISSVERDELTGLYTKRFLLKYAEKMDMFHPDAGMDAVIADVDHYGLLKELYGNDIAEGVLKACATTIYMYAAEHEGIAGRGEEDTFFAYVVATKDHAELAEELNKKVAADFPGTNIHVRVGVFKRESRDVPLLNAFHYAQIAGDSISGNFSSLVAVYDNELRNSTLFKDRLIHDIKTGLETNQFVVYYQPKYAIQGERPRLCGAEALVRWIHKDFGFLTPDKYISLFEQNGLIQLVDRFVWKETAEQIRKWHDKYNLRFPISVNASRMDLFDPKISDALLEIIDDAGIDVEDIHVEVTESAYAKDQERMIEAVKKIRDSGFAIEMDDFGTGYSALNILCSIPLDVLKLDMSFVRQMDASQENEKMVGIILEMAKMLGVGVNADGVENAGQLEKLNSMGCDMVQGFYFSKPIPFDTVREMFRDKTLIANENPEESEYYENIGRISLHDLDIISGDEADSFHNVFSTLPMAVLEIAGQTVRYIRNNPSYREFVRRFFKADLSDRQISLDAPVVEYVNGFFRVVRQCCESGNRIYFNERMPDGSTAHSFVRRLSVNPVTGNVAVAVAVLSVSEPDDSMTYAEIAESLAADYYNIFLIDLDTNHYIEYTRQTDSEEMSLQRHGEDFFESARREALTRICQEDREMFMSLFTRENVLRTIDEQGIFTTVYRLMDTGIPVYVNMKVTRMRGSNHLILGVSVVDAPMRQKAHYEEMQKERDTLIRVMALSDGYIALYTVDLQTEQYAEFSASEDLDSLGVANEGDDFFRQTFVNAESFCFAEDLQRFREQFTRENVLQHIREDGSFSISYRLMIRGKPKQVTLKAVLLKNGNTDKLIIGVRAWKDRK